MVRLAAVEGGGTTFVCAIAIDDPTNVVERAEFPTTTPAETIGNCVAWLKAQQYEALGIASFGPVDLAPNSPTYGYITTTPKPGWNNTDVVGPLRAVRPDVPVAFDTDVNAPAVNEGNPFDFEVESDDEFGDTPPLAPQFEGSPVRVPKTIQQSEHAASKASHAAFKEQHPDTVAVAKAPLKTTIQLDRGEICISVLLSN